MSRLHTRVVGECSYPHIRTVVRNCRGCRNRRQKYHSQHSWRPGDCQWAPAQAPGHVPPERRVPHEPLPPAFDEPTARGGVVGPDGQLIGEEDERRIREMDALARQGQAKHQSIPEHLAKARPPKVAPIHQSFGVRHAGSGNRERAQTTKSPIGPGSTSDQSFVPAAPPMRPRCVVP